MIQKEKFQEYLYNQDACKSADIPELKELLLEYPWFSAAGIILLMSSKMQSDPSFDTLLKSSGITITNRKILRSFLKSDTVYKHSIDKSVKESKDSQHPKSRIIGIFDDHESDSENPNPEFAAQSVLEDDSLLDFTYPSRGADKEIPENNAIEVSGMDDVLTESTFEIEESKPQAGSGDENFDHWIEKLGGSGDLSKHRIIESFIQSDPGVIRADKVTQIQGDISKNSSEENEGFITDTLAKIYVKQGLYHKAIYAYEKLCLKYPEKSIYFASQIEEIKSLYIKK